ncbi:MAG: C40 family peptidase [Muribaculum sp.]|nr:C40 family peptidase [Muribaculum sp.]
MAQDTLSWVQVRIPVACIRDGKGHATEMTSQAIMGTPLKLLEDDVEWLKIQAPDGYEGYVNISSLTRKSDDDMQTWRNAPRVVVTKSPEIKVYSSPEGRVSRDVVSELVLSSIVEGNIEPGKQMVSVKLPDGRSGYVERKYVMPIEDWASRTLDMDSVVDTAYGLMGTSYLWGGCSTKSMDCSGLVRVAYFDRGVLTLRDAREQIGIGKRIEPDDTASLSRGDLLFFSSTPDGRISHVAIYDRDGQYVHSSGLVKTNRMDNMDPDFGTRYYRGASRIAGMEDTPGIMRVKNHPWYFD